MLDTLGQVETANKSNGRDRAVIGDGTDGNNAKAMKGRAKRKLVTQKMVLSLIDVAKKKGDTQRVKMYWRAYHCQSMLTSKDGRVYGNYCRTRFCTICLSIRKAEILNRYIPIIKKWKDAQFVTLTSKAVKENRLEYWIRSTQKAFNRTYRRINKRHYRGKGIKVFGIRSLECNFNPKKKTYNPHYHLIVPNAEIAEELIKEWQRTWNKKRWLSSPKAQHFRRIKTNVEEDLIETVKYGSKIFTDPDIRRNGKKSILPKVYARALDNIFAAMKGKRLFDSFGFRPPKKKKYQSQGIQIIRDSEDWIFNINVANWINPETGETLTSYNPTAQLKDLLDNHIDTDLE